MTRRVKERLAVVRDAVVAERARGGLDDLHAPRDAASSWNAGRRAFLCPCHGGVYGADGRVLAGPPPRPLARAPLAIAGGRVTVDPAAFDA